MKATLLSLSILLLGANLFGCAREEASESSNDATTTEMTTPAIALAGDFQGPLGVQLWSVRNYAADDVTGTLATVHDMGFAEVELAGTYGMTPMAFRDTLRAAGLDATSMHTGYERFRDSLGVVLDEAQALGVTYAGVAWIPHQDDMPFTDDMARAAAKDFNEWGAAAHERGIQFFLHVHGYEFRPGPDGATPFDVIATETNPDDVKFEMDVFWVTRSGTDPSALLRKYPGRWALMHIKDMKTGTATSDYSGHASEDADVPVGTGMINYAEVLGAAKEVGVAKYYIEDESVTPLENIPQSIAYLEKLTF